MLLALVLAPLIDFSVLTHVLELNPSSVCIHGAHVTGWYRTPGGEWQTGEGKFIQLTTPGFRGLGFCAPADLLPGRTCGQWDLIHQEEMAQIEGPLAAIWLSEVVGNDIVEIGGSNSSTPSDEIVWFTRVVAGEGDFNNGQVCDSPPRERPRNCDTFEGKVAIPLDNREWTYYYVRSVRGTGRSAFMLWGVDR